MFKPLPKPPSYQLISELGKVENSLFELHKKLQTNDSANLSLFFEKLFALYQTATDAKTKHPHEDIAETMAFIYISLGWLKKKKLPKSIKVDGETINTKKWSKTARKEIEKNFSTDSAYKTKKLHYDHYIKVLAESIVVYEGKKTMFLTRNAVNSVTELLDKIASGQKGPATLEIEKKYEGILPKFINSLNKSCKTSLSTNDFLLAEPLEVDYF